MNLLRLAVLMFFSVIFNQAHAVHIENFNLSKENFEKAKSVAQTQHPKFWRHVQDTELDGLKIYFTNRQTRPFAWAQGVNTIYISAIPIIKGLSDFSDEKMLIVYWHELGHIISNRASSGEKISKTQGEYEAFHYSLVKGIEVSQSGDKEILRLLIKNLQRRNIKKNQHSYYTLAINKIMKSELWHKAQTMIQGNDK